ncbi:hypothetical protein Acr_01g0000280 [Actinidia rufa]|uniref:Uncharacterized protein n=1 Tax=Actinidia rufa TaxID=165716 RepID=A0A7J0E2S0_9ERIC|nr:hypothetical protein Acr_01g0000280 [Actinidia rufa]
MTTPQTYTTMARKIQQCKSSHSNRAVPVQQQPIATYGAAKESTERGWSLLMDLEGIMPLPLSLTTNSNSSNAEILANVKKTMHEKIAGVVDEHIDGPRKTRLLPVFRKMCPQ